MAAILIHFNRKVYTIDCHGWLKIKKQNPVVETTGFKPKPTAYEKKFA